MRGQNVYFYEKIRKIIPKLDYQVSICSLIPPATAISKTQEPIKHTNKYIQSIIVLYICVKFHENILNDF